MKRHIDRQAAHAALDRLLDLYQGRSPGLLGGEPTAPALGAEHYEILREAEAQLLKLLLPSLPGQQAARAVPIKSHRGKAIAKQLRGKIILWWSHVLGMGTAKAVSLACGVTEVDRRTAYRWIESVPTETQEAIKNLAQALKKEPTQEMIELAKAISAIYDVDTLYFVDLQAKPDKSGAKS